jgi:hypothetical protein
LGVHRGIASIAVGACSQEPEPRAAAELAEQVLATQRAEFVVDPSYSVVLGRDALGTVTNPCSRSFPSGLTGYWEPTSEELRDLEIRLPARLAEEIPLLARPLNTKRIVVARQYVGMIRGGVKVIYVNGMPADLLERQEAEWRSGQLQVCDGGARNFGIVYDTTTMEFDSFAGNSPF